MKIASAGSRAAISGWDTTKLVNAKRAIDEASGSQSSVTIAPDLVKAVDVESMVAEALERLEKIDILLVNSGHMPYGTAEGLDELVRSIRTPRDERRPTDASYCATYARAQVRRHRLYHCCRNSRAERASYPLECIPSRTRQSSQDAVTADNIRVNIIAPGYFDTGRVRQPVNELSAREQMSRAEAAHMDFRAPRGSDCESKNESKPSKDVNAGSDRLALSADFTTLSREKSDKFCAGKQLVISLYLIVVLLWRFTAAAFGIGLGLWRLSAG